MIAVCPKCRKKFKPTRAWQRFDTQKCQEAYWRDRHPRIDLDAGDKVVKKRK